MYGSIPMVKISTIANYLRALIDMHKNLEYCLVTALQICLSVCHIAKVLLSSNDMHKVYGHLPMFPSFCDVDLAEARSLKFL